MSKNHTTPLRKKRRKSGLQRRQDLYQEDMQDWHDTKAFEVLNYKTNRRGIAVKKWLLNHFGSRADCAVVASQLLYWLAPNAEGKVRAKCSDDQGPCLDKSHQKLAEDVGWIDKYKAKKALEKCRTEGLITTETARLKYGRITRIRLGKQYQEIQFAACEHLADLNPHYAGDENLPAQCVQVPRWLLTYFRQFVDCAVTMAQILYWYGLANNMEPRLRNRDEFGKLYLSKTHQDLAHDIGWSDSRRLERILKRCDDAGLIRRQLKGIANGRSTRIDLSPNGMLRAFKAVRKQSAIPAK